MDAKENVIEIAAEIDAYLSAHPQAADSVEGICRWWLARRPHAESLSEVQRALNRLVGLGAVEQRSLPDGTLIYARARVPDK